MRQLWKNINEKASRIKAAFPTTFPQNINKTRLFDRSLHLFEFMYNEIVINQPVFALL